MSVVQVSRRDLPIPLNIFVLHALKFNKSELRTECYCTTEESAELALERYAEVQFMQLERSYITTDERYLKGAKEKSIGRLPSVMDFESKGCVAGTVIMKAGKPPVSTVQPPLKTDWPYDHWILQDTENKDRLYIFKQDQAVFMFQYDNTQLFVDEALLKNDDFRKSVEALDKTEEWLQRHPALPEQTEPTISTESQVK